MKELKLEIEELEERIAPAVLVINPHGVMTVGPTDVPGPSHLVGGGPTTVMIS